MPANFSKVGNTWSVNDGKKRSKASDECLSVRVTTMDADLEFSVPKKITGRELFELVCRTIGLRETWYFGLQFINKKGYFGWISFDLRITSQDIKKAENGYHFYFLAKFFPEDVSEELIQIITQHLFFLQVKQSILNMDIYCPPEASVLLASYAVQAKYGDYCDVNIDICELALEELLPQRVLDQYQMTCEMWEDKIKTWWMNNRRMTKEEAELEYLRIAQDLDMYGMQYFPINNRKESNLWLGVGPLGLNVYEKNNKLIPKASFTWSEIRNIAYKEKKFLIRTLDKNSVATVSFTSQNVAVNKVILDLCIGNHSLYLRRRQPDTLEAEKQKLEKEQERRVQAEKERDRMQQELTKLKEQISAAQEALKRSEETADLLAEKAQISEEEAFVLTKRAADAEAEIQRMRIAAIRNEEEKYSMERKAREAELIAARMVEESESRTREAQKLKNDLMRAYNAEQLAKSKLREVMTSPFSPMPLTNNFEFPTGQDRVHLACSPISDHCIFSGMASSHTDPVGAERDIKSLSAEIEKERVEYLKKSKHLQEQLSELRSEIEGLKVEEQQTDLDRAYQESLQLGDDKYTTLRKSGAGSAKSRKDEIIKTMALPDQEQDSQSEKNDVQIFFEKEDQDACSVDASAFTAQFHQIIEHLLMQMSTDKSTLSIDEVQENNLISVALLKQLNRLFQYKNSILKEELQKVIKEVEQKFAKLQNAQQEVSLIVKEKEHHLNFSSDDQKIALIPLEQFFSEACTDESKKELNEKCPQELHTARLAWELETRKRLGEEIKQLEELNKKMIAENSALKKKLDEFNPLLLSVIKAVRPLQELVGWDSTNDTLFQERLQHLPRPLFFIFMEIIAFNDIYDEKISVSIKGDLAKLAVNLSRSSSLQDVSEMEADTTDGDILTSVGNQLDESRVEEEKRMQENLREYHLSVHPLSVQLEITLDNGCVLLLKLQYLTRLKLLSVHTNVQLPNEASAAHFLFPNDSGTTCPDVAMAAKLQYYKCLFHFAILFQPRIDIAEEIETVGRMYFWLQRLGNLMPVTQQRSDVTVMRTDLNLSDLNISDSLDFLFTVVAAMKRRMRIRFSLLQQLISMWSLELKYPDSVASWSSVASAVEFLSWRCATFADFQNHEATKRQCENKLINNNDWFFKASFKLQTLQLEVLLAVSCKYPDVAPKLFFCFSKNSDKYTSFNNEIVRAMERHVNFVCIKKIPPEYKDEILSVQFKCVPILMHLALHLNFGIDENRDSLIDNLLPNMHRGRDREPPLTCVDQFISSLRANLFRTFPDAALNCRLFFNFFGKSNKKETSGGHSSLISDKNYVYEISYHNVQPGKMESYLKNYENYSKLLEHKSSAQLLGSWSTVYGTEDQAIHLWRFTNGYAGVDETFQLRVRDKEIRLLSDEFAKQCQQRSSSLALSFAFWGEPQPRCSENLYEIRTYILKAGTMLEWAKNWEKAINYRRKENQNVAGFFAQVGRLCKVTHIWAYKSLENRRILREDSWRAPGWDMHVAYTVPLVVKMESNILIPTAFSKMQ
ncbi:Merlin [Trichinella zimbabwensis]|uniref:Moesin/ezrin/radixin homolog 1 n=1 Tax=Trichinella zimbabwensis TaxID=268475 RepID=A0A0V1HU29_9BILA|nr:Merlin [Trichinella zimbabwensis]